MPIPNKDLKANKKVLVSDEKLGGGQKNATPKITTDNTGLAAKTRKDSQVNY